MSVSDLATIVSQLRDLTIAADAISRRLEVERKDRELHRIAVSCRDLASAINHALTTCHSL
jgi:hypothetical protein